MEYIILRLLASFYLSIKRKHSHDLEKVGLIHSKILALDNT